MNAIAQGKAWLKAYRENERSLEMGRALARAREVYEAVAAIREESDGAQVKALAAALVEWRREGVEELRVELIRQARSLLAGSIRIAKDQIDALAGRVERGELLRE